LVYNLVFAGSNAFRHCQAFVDKIILVSDEELIENVCTLFSHGLVVEPSGAAAFTALRTGKIPDIVGKKVVVVITGGNITEKELAHFMTKRTEVRDKTYLAEQPVTTFNHTQPKTTIDLKGNLLAAMAHETGKSLANVKQNKKCEISETK
jgi:threonine synthase